VNVQASRLQEFQETLGYHFKDPRLLIQALVHRSFIHENTHLDLKDNETLEFLGDAVLGLTISHLLLTRFPQYNEGDLSRLRSSIVNERELSVYATRLKLGDFLFLGKGEELTGGRQKPSLLADSLEALLGAVYLDGGLEAAIRVVRDLFHAYIDIMEADFPLKSIDKDYKTQLQELTQARFKATPVYYLESEEGPDHDKTFYMNVTLDGEVLARGAGKSKKEAQQEAAQQALLSIAERPESAEGT
jgi:ribonuclease III